MRITATGIQHLVHQAGSEHLNIRVLGLLGQKRLAFVVSFSVFHNVLLGDGEHGEAGNEKDTQEGHVGRKRDRRRRLLGMN